MQYEDKATSSQASDGHRNSDRLARELIRHMGVAGALRTCRENHWDGVLMAVEAQAGGKPQA